MNQQSNEIKELRKQVNRQNQRISALIRLLQRNMTGVITVTDAALLGYYCEDSLYRMIAKGELLAYRPSTNRLLIDYDDFLRFLKTNPTK